MSRQPEDREGIRSRAYAQAGFGVVGLAVGFGVLLVSGGDHLGLMRVLPAALRPVVGLVILAVSGFFAASALRWAFVPLRGARPPVVRFTPDRLEVRGPLVPFKLVVERHQIVDVYLWHLADSVGEGLGLWPMVVVRTSDGRGRGIQFAYAGSPEDLADDVASWASANRSESRRGLMALSPAGED